MTIIQQSFDSWPRFSFLILCFISYSKISYSLSPTAKPGSVWLVVSQWCVTPPRSGNPFCMVDHSNLSCICISICIWICICELVSVYLSLFLNFYLNLTLFSYHSKAVMRNTHGQGTLSARPITTCPLSIPSHCKVFNSNTNTELYQSI